MTSGQRLCLALFAGAILASIVSPRTVRADDAEEARFHDELARRHYAARRYEPAIREFFLERDLAPNPRITFNLALCFDALHRDADAYLLFAEYLAGDDDDAQRRTLANDALARLGPRVARVLVTSDPPGATVFVDQREHGSYGVTPVELALAAGPHTLLLERAGHHGARTEITAELGRQTEATATLARVVGSVSIEGRAGAGVAVRDATGSMAAQGTLPFTAALPPGDYAVEVTGETLEPWHGLARVEADAVTAVPAESSLRAAPTSQLTITASAAGATIEVDGEVSGFAPAVLHGLEVGSHRVRVAHPGLVPWEGTVALSPEVTHWLTVSLATPTATERSVSTWIVGGAGLAALVLGGTLGALALDAEARFDALEAQASRHALGMGPAPMGSLLDTRAQGLTLASAADGALLGATGLLAVAIVLYFATETTEARLSTASFADSERPSSEARP